MITIIPTILKKRSQQLPEDIFAEKNQGKAFSPDDILEDPAALLKSVGLTNILDSEPIKNIITGATVWEYYLLGIHNNLVKRREYRILIGKPGIVIKGNRGGKLGNPYNGWKARYARIDKDQNPKLASACRPFCEALINRKCPLREADNSAFMNKRKGAAKAFFRYLLKDQLNLNEVQRLKKADYYYNLTLLIKMKDHTYLTAAGLMICLYGGKDEMEIPGGLAKAVVARLSKSATPTDSYVFSEVIKKLKACGKKKFFSPPINSIYSPGKRSLVLTNYRVPVWLKLLSDTYEASL